jgi:hypothetical protein
MLNKLKVINTIDKDEINEFIAGLPVDSAQVWRDYHERKLSVKEIAKKKNWSQSKVYTILNTTIFKLTSHFIPGTFKRAFSILYPEFGKPTPTVSSIASECDLESNQNTV